MKLICSWERPESEYYTEDSFTLYYSVEEAKEKFGVTTAQVVNSVKTHESIPWVGGELSFHLFTPRLYSVEECWAERK